MVVCNDEGRQRCLVCDQRFEATSTPCQLYTHVVAKHEAILKRPDKCFPCLRDFDQFTDVKLGASADVTETEGDTGGIRYDTVQATKHYPIERYECPAAKQGKTTDELCAGAFRGRVQSDEFIELANLTLGGDGAQEVAELEYKVANEKGSAKLLGEQSI